MLQTAFEGLLFSEINEFFFITPHSKKPKPKPMKLNKSFAKCCVNYTSGSFSHHVLVRISL